MSDMKMYNILGAFNNVDPKLNPVEQDVKAEPVYESVEPRGDIMEAVKSLEEKYMGFKKTVAAVKKGGSAEDPEAVAAAIGRKKYGKEKFQKAAAAGKKLGEGEYEPAAPDADAIAKRKRLQALKDKQEDERAEKGSDHKSNVRTVKGKAYGGSAQKDAPEADDMDESLATGLADLAAGAKHYRAITTRKPEHYASAVDAHNKAAAAHSKAAGNKPTAGGKYADHTKASGYHAKMADIYRSKGNMPPSLADELGEVAPPGAKAERMVKHIKKGYAKDGKLTKKEKGIAYATAWKAHKAGKLQESVIQESDYTYERIGKKLAETNPTLDTASPSFVTAVYNEMVAQGIAPNRARNIIKIDDDFISDVASSYAHYCQEVAECGAPINSFVEESPMAELDEIARLAGVSTKQPVMDDEMDEGNAFTGKLASTPKGGEFELDGKKFKDTSSLEEEEMEEGNEFSGALAQARASGAKEFEVDGKKYTVKEAQEKLDEMINANINFTADDLDAVTLMKLLSGIQPREEEPAQVPAEVPAQPEVEVAEERDIEHSNTPREEVAGVDAAIPAGADLNRAKKQYKKEYPGDNPMAVEESLWKSYEAMINDVKE